jgi:hypothetical protein
VPSKDPTIVRQGSWGSLPQLHLPARRWAKILNKRESNAVSNRSDEETDEPLIANDQREQPPGPYVFASERSGPIAAKSFHTLISRLGGRAGMAFPIHPHKRATSGKSERLMLARHLEDAAQ